MRNVTAASHPTNLGPRQQVTARSEAEMIAARATMVHKYLREGESFAVNTDADAVAQLEAMVNEAQALIALFGRASNR